MDQSLFERMYKQPIAPIQPVWAFHDGLETSDDG